MGADGFLGSEILRGGAVDAIDQPPPDIALAEAAANAFAVEHPDHSARQPTTPSQRRIAAILLGLIAAAALAAPSVLVLAFSAILLFSFALILGWRTVLVASALIYPRPEKHDEVAILLLPVYTILIALKHEATSMPALAAAMTTLDYPRDRLDLKLLIETGDDTTRDAILAQSWPTGTQLLILPPGDPRTKPRALNYGLASARGTYVVVYDAEDRPDPSQLKAAARAFASGGPDLACVQAPLVGLCPGRNWLAGQWALEYAIQFGLVLPALARWNMPIALGGTSNHLRRSALLRCGGWDAWNVTEDADLGLRFARSGLRVDTISPPTFEKPPQKLQVWIAQRSRWLKGFVQTWLVLMRHPAKAMREMGTGAFLSMQLTLGGAILSALAHGPWALWCLFCLVSPQLSLGPVSVTALAVSYICGIAVAWAAPGPRDGARLFHVLTLPLYWPLQSIAMGRALFGMFRCPHFWAKTPHD